MNLVKTGLLALVCIISGALLSYEFPGGEILCLGTAPGTILASSSRKNIIFDEVRLLYEYKVNGKKYRSSRFSVLASTKTHYSQFLPRGWGEKITAMFPAGAPVRINYSIGFPGISLLHINDYGLYRNNRLEGLNNDHILAFLLSCLIDIGSIALLVNGLFLCFTLLLRKTQNDNMP